MNNQYNKNEIDSPSAWPKFEQEKYFFISMDAIFVELEFNSTNAIEKIDNEITHEQQQFVCVLEIKPSIETPEEDLN